MNIKQIKKFLYTCFYSPTDTKAKITNGIIGFLILISIAVIPLHFIARINEINWIEPYLFLFDKIIVTIFTVEYILRIWTNKHLYRFIFSWEGLIDISSILPFYLDKFGFFGDYPFAFEIFLMLRILRILRFTTMYGIENEALEKCESHGKFYRIPGEKIERVVQKHPLIFIAGMIMPLVFTSIALIMIIISRTVLWNAWATASAVLFFALAGMFFVKAWLDYNYDVVYITTHRVILQNHELFGSETNGLMYDSITNVVPSNRGFFRWALGLGHIEIETANRDATIVFESVRHPHRVVRHISENRVKNKKKYSQGKMSN